MQIKIVQTFKHGQKGFWLPDYFHLELAAMFIEYACSIQHHLDFSVKHSAMRQLIRENDSYTNFHHIL